MKYTLCLTLLSVTLLGMFCHGSLLADETLPAEVDEVLLSEEEPRRLETVRLIGYLSDRNAAIREAAVRRLSLFPEATGKQVIDTLMEDDLASRLAALEILTEWKFSVNTIDPWRKETLTEAARTTLMTEWKKKYQKASDGEDDPDPIEEDPPKILSKSQLAEARYEIDRMLRAKTDQEATAIRERLYRLGPALLDEVRGRLKNVANNRDYELLTTLRYRLASSPSLSLRWPRGLQRLASTDAKTRQKAAEELMEKMEQGDQPLLVELFANPDSMVREISLQGLQKLGTRDSLDALSRLLDDPEPNVRAAILKMAVESPSPAFVREVIKYLDKETDADLLVHGIQVLKKGDGEKTAKVLIKMVQHESWQVRAEAAEALESFCGSTHRYVNTTTTFINGEMVEKSGEKADPLVTKVYTALLNQLKKEEDAFVLDRLVDRLNSVDMETAVEPLVDVIERRPELAEKIIATLGKGAKMRTKSQPHLERFTKHKDAKIRAAAIRGLMSLQPAQEKKFATINAGLNDQDEKVQLTVLRYLVHMIELDQTNEVQKLYHKYHRDEGTPVVHPSGWATFDGVEYTPTPRKGGGLGGFFRGIAEGMAEAVKEASPKTEKEVLPETPKTKSLKPNAPRVEPSEVIDVDRIPRPVTLPSTEEHKDAMIPIAPATPKVLETVPLELKGKIGPNEMEAIQSMLEQELKTRGVKVQQKEKKPKTVAKKTTPGHPQKPSKFTPVFDDYQKWLADYTQGKNRDDWLDKIIPLLEKSLEAGSTEERVLAARILIPLGKTDKSLDVLLKTVEEVFGEYHDATATKKEGASKVGVLWSMVFEHATKTLSWLPVKQRREVYHKLKKYAREEPRIQHLITGASTPLDPVLVEDFWTFLKDEPAEKQKSQSYSRLDHTLSGTFEAAFLPERESYLPMSSTRGISGVTKEKARQIVDHQIAKGNKRQRLMAFTLLQKTDREKASKQGDQWLSDKKLPIEFRDEVFQLLLLTVEQNDARRLAVEMLKDSKARKIRRKNSLRYLTIGKNALQENLTTSGIFSISHSWHNYDKPIVPELPTGVTLEMVKPFLKDKDPEVAGLAGYLVSICGEEEGLPPLLKFWNQKKNDDRYDQDNLQRLVYRAIAYLNATDKLDVLREIFNLQRQYQLDEFYWTIRIMSGEKILKFRKEVREKAGGIQELM